MKQIIGIVLATSFCAASAYANTPVETAINNRQEQHQQVQQQRQDNQQMRQDNRQERQQARPRRRR